MSGFVPLTREELEEARTFLKTYFPNKGDDRHVFNRICDMAQISLTDRAQRTEARPRAEVLELARRIVTARGDSGRDLAHDAYADEVAAELLRVGGEPQHDEGAK